MTSPKYTRLFTKIAWLALMLLAVLIVAGTIVADLGAIERLPLFILGILTYVTGYAGMRTQKVRVK